MSSRALGTHSRSPGRSSGLAPEAAALDRLWQRYRDSPDQSLREDLASAYLPLVHYLVGRAAINLPPHVEQGDLEGVAILGLLRCIDRFDLSKDIKFETFATYRIRGAILDYLRKQDVLPRPLRKKAIELEAATEQLRQRLQRIPTAEEIAAAIGLSLPETQELIWRASTGYMVSLDQEVYLADEEGSRSLKESLTNALELGPWELLEQADLIRLLTEAIAELPDRQQLVLSLYYYEERTLKEIGELLKVTESRVCQIRGEAVHRLRQKLLLQRDLRPS